MHKTYGEQKQKLLADHPTEIVELGPGAGANFRYYRAGTRIRAVEPNPNMHAYLRQRARRFRLQLELMAGKAESIRIPARSVPMVVGTLILCSVDDPAAVVGQIARMLTDTGKYVFIEHVAAPRKSLPGFEQRILRRPWPWLFNGCRVDQRSLEIIEQGKFEMVASQRFQIGGGWLPFSPHVCGTAVR